MNNLLIKNAKLRHSEYLTDILIKNGKFDTISENINPSENVKVIDAKGNLAAPPMIDPHVHLDAVL
ncbi:MAG: cytosine deaminase, partial [Anaerovoracaceae bacterium]